MEARGIGWLAGLVEGEGSFCVFNGKAKSLNIQMTDQDVIEHVQQEFGGKVYACSSRSVQWKPSWRWQICGDAAVNLAKQMIPYLFSRRQAQAQAFIIAWELQQTSAAATIDRRSNLVERIVQLRAEGLTHAQIGQTLGISRSGVGLLLQKHAALV